MLWFKFNLGLKFYFLFFLVMVMRDNEFETKENTISSKDKIEPQHIQSTTQGFRPLKSHSDVIKHHTSC